MKRTITLTIFLVGLFLTSAGQNFSEQFNDLVSKKDTVAQQKLLDNWKSSKPNDAELYVAFFNYYMCKSRTEVIRLGNNPPNDHEVLQIMDTDTTKKEPVSYMYSEIYYQPEILNIGFAYIDTGITKFPTRLDMRFGKVYMFGETKEYDSFTNEIIKTIDYSATIKNKWTWSNNEPVKDDPEKFMLLSVQDYFLQLYNTGDDGQADNMKKISETVLKHYPDNVENLSNLGICYLLKNDLDNALTTFLKAEKVSPKDYIVLSNIAHCYNLKKDTKNAIKYYELTAKYGDDNAKEFANQKLNELRQK